MSQASSIAGALGDVIASARLLLTDQVKLARLEARSDLAHVLRAAALGLVALVAAAVAIVMAAISAMQLLSQWIPIYVSMALIAAICGASAVALFVRAQRSLPTHLTDTNALPPGVQALPEAISDP